jgi:hypothetical protein
LIERQASPVFRFQQGLPALERNGVPADEMIKGKIIESHG